MTEAGAEGAEAVVEKGSKGVRVKALPKPDREAFDAECARHVGAQEAHTARLAALDAQIKERNASRKTSASSSETGDSRARLAELNAAFKRALVRCRAPVCAWTTLCATRRLPDTYLPSAG
jgi:hypothetical protein